MIYASVPVPGFAFQLALPFLLLQTLDLLHPLALLCVTTLLQLGSALS